MGLILGFLVTAIAAPLLLWLGPQPWLLVVVGVLVLAGLVACVLRGHRALGGRGNTDLTLYLAIILIAAALVVPRLAKGGAEAVEATSPPSLNNGR